MTPSHDGDTITAFRQEFDASANAGRARARLSWTTTRSSARSTRTRTRRRCSSSTSAATCASRWTDPFTTDGEKPDRRRDREFELEAGDSRDRLMERWAVGWAAVRATLDALRPDDLAARRSRCAARRTPMPRALTRSLAHTAGHVHQIVLLARHWSGRRWSTPSIPRGQSETFRPPH